MALIEQKRFGEAHHLLVESNEVDIAEWLSEMEDDPCALVVFRMLPKAMAADVFAYLSHDMQQQVVERLTDKELASVVDELFLDDTVDFVEEMPATIVKRVIRAADPETRKQINQLLLYPDDSAGSLMTLEFMELDDIWTVNRAIEAIRRQAANKESISIMYVTDKKRLLEGEVSLMEVLTASDEQKIGDIMSSDVIKVRTHDHQEDVAELFKKYDLLSMPVVDQENRLVGIITIDDVVDVIEEETTEDIYKMAAMAPIVEAYMETSTITHAKNRVLWLLFLMISATFTGMIISRYEMVLAANVLLASFIPMLMDTGGNAGSQSSVAVIRALTLKEVDFPDMLKIMWKETGVSLLTGVCVAGVNFFRVWLSNGDPMVALAVSLTLIVIIVSANIVGSALPLIAQKVGIDPALMASPLITTIVDAAAIFAFFNIAVMVIPGLAQ